MTWETITVSSNELAPVLDRLRSAGATITRCCPATGVCLVTYCSRAYGH